MNLENFRHNDWTNIWAWSWSFLSCSHFGVEYTQLIKFNNQPFMSQAIIKVANGKSGCWIRQSDRNLLGNYLANELRARPELAKERAGELKKQVDKILNFIVEQEKNTELNLQIFQEYFTRVVEYYHPHIFVKYIVDYLTPEELNKYLPELENARLYAESVFKRTEDLINHWAEIVAKKTGVEKNLVLNLTYLEVEEYLRSDLLPDISVLKSREISSVLIFDKDEWQIFVGEEADLGEKLLNRNVESNTLTGQTVFVGKVKGVVRVILDPKGVKEFNEGDILVAGMTRPDYLPLMKRAGAFVTDGGGILCHAAIVAREFKKPCIIGTEIATKFLHDGDLVEVDANEGIIKKIK